MWLVNLSFVSIPSSSTNEFHFACKILFSHFMNRQLIESELVGFKFLNLLFRGQSVTETNA